MTPLSRWSRCVLLTLAASASIAWEWPWQRGFEAKVNPRAQNRKGIAAYQAGNYERALEDFAAAARMAPGEQELVLNQAAATYKKGDFEAAARAYESVANSPDRSIAKRAAYGLGNTRYRQEQFAPALEQYKRALRLDSGDVEAKYNLEATLRKLAEQKREGKGDEKNDPSQQNEPQEGKNGKNGDEDEPGQKDAPSSPSPSPQPQPSPASPSPSTEQPQPSPASPSPSSEAQNFERQAGMSKQQAEQILQAIEQAEKEEREKELKRAIERRGPGKDW